ncbi:septum site-determining protein MinC [Halobacillus naozhouensis]|uniref:Probable septum site-determining protein MinC n=1 Tax=Halobacillus naozhouensis TaxID=554880 RepID=A0ABY8IVZ1_9BACI|nr:septum site-determining protein MinC [Halobacillus naozhouensis]WFT73388.1 septum site-determining protein MinC [Halobacillus naozhouensis]
MAVNGQIVMIKGTRDGLILHLNDQCSFESIIHELEQKLSVNGVDHDEPMIRVTIRIGKRYLSGQQQETLKEIVREKQRLVVEAIESEVMTKKEALAWKENTEVTPIVKTIRSGQVFEVRGDMLLIGDVNPGGQVMATGNIFIMGRLRGVAHAGTQGDEQAIIAASYMKPNQLRIADQLSRAPDYESEGVYMECGFVDEVKGSIRIESLQEVTRRRPDLASFERRMLNG